MDERQNIEDAQNDAAVAYMAYRELHQQRKNAMLNAYKEIKETDGVDAETAFMSFGKFDAESALELASLAKTKEERNEAISRLAAPFIWTAFQMLDELKREGKIKEDE